MKNGMGGIAGLAAGAASYASVWLTPRSSNVFLFMALCGLFGFLASLISDARVTVVLMSVVSGVFLLNVAHIAVDTSADPTSHNLFPFELAFNLLLAAVGAGVGIAVAQVARRVAARQG